jgi:hypothetical protein
MGRGSNKAESDEAPGAPEWMVTFSDCMTLLLIFRRLQASFLKALPDASQSDEANRDAVLPTEQIEETPELVKGSEKPTLVKGFEDNLKKDTPADYRRLKVFSISSERVFWGRGALISAEGRRTMTKMASFLKEGSEQLGLSRAWAVMEYLTTEHNLNKKWFSISAASTLAQHQLSLGSRLIGAGEPERILEIVLLERSIYN